MWLSYLSELSSLLSVQRSQELGEVLKTPKSPVEEETCGIRSRSSGVGTSEGLSEENKRSSRSREEIFHSRPLDPEDTWQEIHVVWAKYKREYPRGGLTKSELAK
jgi:hypothetical protein